jgi:RNA polymerase sigma factor (sigma-70 family)
MCDASTPQPERKQWPQDWTFEQRREESHTEAQRFAYRILEDWHLAEDAVQKSEQVLWERMEAGEQVSRAKYFTIVRNKAVDALRKKICKRKLGVPESEFNTPNDDGKFVPFLSTLPDEKSPQPDKSAQQPEQSPSALLDKMHRWLETVCPDGAEVFRVHKLEEQSQSETARILGVNANTVKMRWRKACTLLRNHFRKFYDELYS